MIVAFLGASNVSSMGRTYLSIISLSMFFKLVDFFYGLERSAMELRRIFLSRELSAACTILIVDTQFL